MIPFWPHAMVFTVITDDGECHPRSEAGLVLPDSHSNRAPAIELLNSQHPSCRNLGPGRTALLIPRDFANIVVL
jgi:hypothetical protein